MSVSNETDRPYRAAPPLGVAREMIASKSGTQLHAILVEAFGDVSDHTFEQLAAQIG